MSDTRPHPVCPVDALDPGDRRVVELENRSIGVFNIEGEYYALANVCPHQRAPLCEGELRGTTSADGPGNVTWERDGQILVCPWHGWEFDVRTGDSVFNPHQWGATTYDTDVVSNPEAVDAGDEEPAVETFPVGVEDEIIVVYL